MHWDRRCSQPSAPSTDFRYPLDTVATVSCQVLALVRATGRGRPRGSGLRRKRTDARRCASATTAGEAAPAPGPEPSALLIVIPLCKRLPPNLKPSAWRDI